jgi:uncharacterized protein (TIGR03437 family)
VNANGLISTPVDVSVNPVGLPTGTFNGTLTFSAVGGGNNPQVVNVSLTISNNPTLTSAAAISGLTYNYELGQSLPGPQTVSVGSSGAALPFGVGSNQNTTSNNVTWLLMGAPGATTTPASFSVAVSPTGMAPGQYTGSITLTTPGGGNQVTIPVTLNITNAGTPLIFTNPKLLTFNLLAGGTADQQLISANTTAESISYTVTPNVTTPTGGTWLVTGPPNGPASAVNISNFFVGLSQNASTLPTGTYKGTVTVNPNNATPNAIIPVTLNVTQGNLTVAPATLNFTQAAGGAAPPAQTISVTSTGSALQFSAFASGGNWLSVSPANATTPGQLSVTVTAAGMAAGSYSGQINIVAAGAGNSPQTVTVNLTVGPGQSLVVSTRGTANALSFTSAAGIAPPSQTIGVTASAGSLPFVTVIGITTPQGGNWLSVSPISGTAGSTPANLTVSVNPQGLNPGTYTGSITFTATNASNSPLTINVTYVVTAIPTPAPTTVQNGGSFQSGAVAPGEIITIKGTNLGPPAPGVIPTVSSNRQPTLASDTQVTFDNNPAPLLYVSAGQVNALVPYEVAGRAQTRMIVTYKGTPSTALVLNVADSAPGIFPSSQPGVPPTQGAIANDDGTLNSPSSPAIKGHSIVFYATGEGQTNPAGVDGLIIPADGTGLKKPVLPVQVMIGGVLANLQYAGSAPGFVSGALQINVAIPDGAPSGPAVPIVVTIGNASSGGGTTVAVE